MEPLRGPVLLVTAHPDDEVMFFSPYLLYCKSKGIKVSVLCLSNGDYEGLGSIREKELYQSASVLGIPHGNVFIIRDDRLLDGNDWSAANVGEIVLRYLQISCNKPQILVTFDDYGVSGHHNHISTYRGIESILCSLKEMSISVYRLESVHILRKFTGFFDLLATGLSSSREDVLVVNVNIFIIFHAMKSHQTQFVWYRIIFLLLSRYSYINLLKLMNIKN